MHIIKQSCKIPILIKYRVAVRFIETGPILKFGLSKPFQIQNFQILDCGFICDGSGPFHKEPSGPSPTGINLVDPNTPHRHTRVGKNPSWPFHHHRPRPPGGRAGAGASRPHRSGQDGPVLAGPVRPVFSPGHQSGSPRVPVR